MKNNVEEVIVSFKGKPLGEPFFESQDFKMYSFDVNLSEYPEIKSGRYGNVVVKGDLVRLSIRSEYIVKAKELYDSRYGYSYSVINIKSSEIKSSHEMYTFLSELLTPLQAEALYSAYPDIVQRVIDNNLKDIDLSKLKGIGESTFAKIVSKIQENYQFADLISEFNGLFSFAVIKKLYNKYSSIEMIKKKLQSSPYEFLTSLDNIGFKKADKIILDYEKKGKLLSDEPLKCSKQRCKAFITYTLSENMKNGNTCMDIIKLQKQCINEVKDCANYFVECVREDNFYYNKELKVIMFKNIYEKEKYIADKLKEALSSPRIDNFDIEKYRNCGEFALTDEQMQAFVNTIKNNVSMLIGGGGCVDCDTEFFTGEGWKKISDYTDGDKVLQWNYDGTAELVYPERYIKLPEKYLYHFESKYGINQTLSLEHNVIWRSAKGKIYKTKFSDLYKQYLDSYTNLRKLHFITTFDYNKKDNVIKLTDDEIRLCIAVFADGHFSKDAYNPNSTVYQVVRFNLKKERKITRLRNLLDRMGIEYREIKLKGTGLGYTDFYFKSPLLCKNFPKEWYNCTKHQKQVIIDEINYWDGCHKINNCYSTTHKEDADFIQFVYSSMGYRATIRIDDRKGQKYKTYGKEYVRKSVGYEVRYTNSIYPGLNCDKRSLDKHVNIDKVETIDGYKYCFTVPSGALVLRRDNKIFITGNSGKTATTETMTKMFDDYKKSYLLFAPTGKAAKVLASYTNKRTATIHRGLGYNPTQGWVRNKDNPLSVDYVIVDEFSMVDILLFFRLIDAIDFNRTKLIMIGDSAQLASVSAGNCLHDMINSGIIPIALLTKVFRYGKGGVATASTDCKNQIPYLDSMPDAVQKGIVTHYGENRDFTFVRCQDADIIKDTLAIYSKLIKNEIPVDDIIVTSAYNVGDYGVVKLNNLLQRIANKNYGSEECFKVGQTTYYIGDVVMQTVNNYNSKIYDVSKDRSLISKLKNKDCIPDENDDPFDSKDTTLICNGESGRIVKILKYGVVIEFDSGCVVYNNKEMQTCQLGYACTIHKMQGDARKYVIILSPKAHTFMLSSNLLYVALTRTKTKCYQLGLPSVIKSAVKKKDEEKRKTLLKYLLKD